MENNKTPGKGTFIELLSELFYSFYRLQIT